MHTLYVKFRIGFTAFWKCNSDIHQKNAICTLKYTFLMSAAVTGIYLSSVGIFLL
jgi:hypothetical protein